jgi:hypothetical protein
MTWRQQWLDAIFDEITFFFLLSFSSFFFDYDYAVAAADNNIHTYMQRQQRAHKKKWGSRFFFSSFSFTPFYCFVYGAASASMSRWCSCFLGNDGTTERQGRERRRNALVSTLVSWQAKIYRFAIYYRPLLSSLLCLSLSLPLSFFFVNSALYAHALLFAYTCHCAMFHEHKHTCTNEADDDSSAIISKKKSINAAMTCNL